MSKQRRTYTVPDYSQAPVMRDSITCRRCNANFRAEINTEVNSPLVECPWCRHLQEYTGIFRRKQVKK